MTLKVITSIMAYEETHFEKLYSPGKLVATMPFLYKPDIVTASCLF